MRPAFRRGSEGEGKLNRRPGAGQRARSDRHSGAAILLWEREGKALGVPTSSGNGAARFPRPHRGTKTAPLHGATPAGWCARATVRQRPSGKERGKSASGSARKRRPLTGLPGQSASARTPAPLILLLIVTRMGRDYRPGSRQRIERVARRAAPLAGLLAKDTASRYQQREIRFRPEATSGRRWSGLQSHPNGTATK